MPLAHETTLAHEEDREPAVETVPARAISAPAAEEATYAVDTMSMFLGAPAEKKADFNAAMVQLRSAVHEQAPAKRDPGARDSYTVDTMSMFEGAPAQEKAGFETAMIQLRSAIQMVARSPADTEHIQSTAARGMSGGGGQLPYLEQIQASFGRHDVSGVQAHTGAQATAAAEEMGALAYASGNSVVLGAGTDFHTVAHEAAHVVQQRAGVSLKGGVGAVGDQYEQHADAVADLVVAGKSAESLLDQYSGGGGGGGVQQSVQMLGKSGSHAPDQITVEVLGAEVQMKQKPGKTKLTPEDLKFNVSESVETNFHIPLGLGIPGVADVGVAGQFGGTFGLKGKSHVTIAENDKVASVSFDENLKPDISVSGAIGAGVSLPAGIAVMAGVRGDVSIKGSNINFKYQGTWERESSDKPWKYKDATLNANGVLTAKALASLVLIGKAGGMEKKGKWKLGGKKLGTVKWNKTTKASDLGQNIKDLVGWGQGDLEHEAQVYEDIEDPGTDFVFGDGPPNSTRESTFMPDAEADDTMVDCEGPQARRKDLGCTIS